MQFSSRIKIFLCIFIIAGMVLFACSKPPKEAKIKITESEFAIRKLSEFAYTIDVKGKLKNVGEVDVKKVVVTGQCKVCATGLAPGRWTVVAEEERERSDEEKDVIQYLHAGSTAMFSFTDLAIMYNTVPEEPGELPEQMEVVIVSFETVD